jgi:hypothetical protein
MSNATVRANARAMPEATNRRAVLGAVLAAGALGATAALPVYAAPGPAALSATDRRVLDLWRRRRRMRGALERISNEIDAATAQMPEWARSGTKYVLSEGQIPEPSGGFCGWPQVADIDQQPIDAFGRILARPNVEDLYVQFKADIKAMSWDGARRRLIQAFLAHDARVNEQDAEEDRVGLNRLNARSETGWSVVSDIEEAISKHTEASVLAVAASLIIGISADDDEEDVLQTYRAALAAIRPQLVSAIAADADRVLAEKYEEAA